VANLAALYDTHHVAGLRLGTQKAKRREVAAITEAWGNRQVASITRKDVVKLIDKRAATPNTANSAAKNIAAFLQFCVDRGELEFSPAARIKRRKVKSRDRILDDAEIAKVWQQADAVGRHGSLVQLLLLTGARRDEIASLRWSEVKASTIELPADRTKTGVGYNIALTDQMRAILDRYQCEGEFVFNGERKLFMTSTARKKINVAGVPRWTLHDLRRSFASGCAALGVAPHIVERCLNHGKQSAVASIYNRFSYRKEMAAAWRSWSEHVEAAPAGPQATSPRRCDQPPTPAVGSTEPG
jgi:integrase